MSKRCTNTDSLSRARTAPVAGRVRRARIRAITVTSAALALVSSGPALAQLPAPKVSLSSLGVSSSGDATAALQRAIDGSGGRCLDGGGRTFVTSQSLQARGDLCLVNASIVFRAPPVDTRALIGGRCEAGADPSRRIDCGDRAARGELGQQLVNYAYRRTLFVSGEGGVAPEVTLVNVSIDRGNDPRAGSRSDSAALWIDGARRIRLDNVEITGAGKGHGLFVSNSRDVETVRLHVHDMVWAPYAGDTPLDLDQIRAKGWNRPTIREIEASGGQSARFVGTRVQEQLSCVTFVSSRQIVMRDTRVANCGAQFEGGVYPWQADGINLGSGTSDVRIVGNTRIDRTWEGIDIVGSGGGVHNVLIDGARITDSFSIGVKMGNRVTSATVRNSAIDGAGLAGVMLYGPADGIGLGNLTVSGIGDDARDAAYRREWVGEKAAVLIDRDGAGVVPRKVDLESVTITGGRSCAAGVLYRGNSVSATRGLSASGCAQATRRR